MVESDRKVPTELTSTSATEFTEANSKDQFHFTLDADGHGKSVVLSSTPDHSYDKTGEQAGTQGQGVSPSEDAVSSPRP